MLFWLLVILGKDNATSGFIYSGKDSFYVCWTPESLYYGF